MLCNLTNAQIQMNLAGKVGIYVAPETGYNLIVGGMSGACVKFKNNPSYPSGDLIINPSSSYALALYPAQNNFGNIGLSNKVFHEIWCYYSTINPSDVRQKENIKNIDNALSLVLKLHGVRFDLKKEFAYSDSIVKDIKIKAKLEKERKNKIGFIAQDVNKILPEVVVHDDSTDIYGIQYGTLVPLLVEAIKEQQAQIDSLKQMVIKNFSSLKSAEIVTGVNENSSDAEIPVLEQNVPNPFSVATTIHFYIPDQTQIAYLYVYDLQGLQKKSFHITSKGRSGIIINGYELLAGMYLYTLITDGKEVDTKKMILTE